MCAKSFTILCLSERAVIPAFTSLIDFRENFALLPTESFKQERVLFLVWESDTRPELSYATYTNKSFQEKYKQMKVFLLELFCSIPFTLIKRYLKCNCLLSHVRVQGSQAEWPHVGQVTVGGVGVLRATDVAVSPLALIPASVPRPRFRDSRLWKPATSLLKL